MNEFIKNMLALGAELENTDDPVRCVLIINDAEVSYRRHIKALKLIKDEQTRNS